MGVERRAVGLLPAAVLTVLTVAFPLPAGAGGAMPVATPRAVCGPGSVPEQGMQGRMTAADYHLGVRCNLELVGHTGPPIGGFRTHATSTGRGASAPTTTGSRGVPPIRGWRSASGRGPTSSTTRTATTASSP